MAAGGAAAPARVRENSDVPAITPDGAQVVYPSDRDGKWRLWLAPLRGGAARPVTPREVSPFAQRFSMGPTFNASENTLLY